MKKFGFLVALACLGMSLNVYAATNTEDKQDTTADYSAGAEEKYQKVISDYKKYLSTVNKDVINEVTTFRVEVEKLNKQKQDLYHRLSQEAQSYLATEREFKRKLPRNQRASLNQAATNE